MWGTRFRANASVVILAFAALVPPFATAQAAYKVDVPAQELGEALRMVGRQTSTNIIFEPSLVKGLSAGSVRAELTADQAIQQLLVGTRLAVRRTSPDTVVVQREQEPAPVAAPTPASRAETSRLQEEEQKSFWSRLRVAQVNEGPAESTRATAESPVEGRLELEEVIVTAARREQSAQDYAGALQVVSGSALDRLGADSFDDYALSIPSVSFRDQGNGATRISMRGVSNLTGSDFGAVSTGSPVGLYLNDVPIQGTSFLPDLGLYDLSRIEVLKGPQGTLYGEGAMGGAIKMVLNPPDFQDASFIADAGASDTKGGGLNYTLRSVLNAPLATDKAALRLVGSYRNEEGFIDNVTTGVKDFNPVEGHSLRALLGLQPNERLSAEVLVLRDELEQDGAPQVNPDLRDLALDSAEPLFSDTSFTLFALTLKYDLGIAELTSVTSYNEAQQEKNVFSPASRGLASAGLAAYNTQKIDGTVFADSEVDSTSQELRLVSQGDSRLGWVAGAFYRDKEYQLRDFGQTLTDAEFASVAAFLTANGLPLPSDRQIDKQTSNENFKQWAVYAEASFDITDRLSLVAGLRWFEEDGEVHYRDIDPSGLRFTSVFAADLEGSDTGVLPKFGISYAVTDHHLLYATASKGFRASAANVLQVFGLGEGIVESDTLWNYELGAKTAWFDGRFIFNASAYYTDWSDLQAVEIGFSPVFGAELGFLGNGGDAEIRGAEVELNARLTDRFSLGVNAGYADSELTSTTSGKLVGAPLPNTPEWTASAFVDYRVPLRSWGAGYVHYDVSYVDSQNTILLVTPEDDVFLDAYALSNVQVGIDTPNDFSVALYVNNISDKRAQFGRDLSFANIADNTGRFSIARPRTVGLRLTKRW